MKNDMENVARKMRDRNVSREELIRRATDVTVRDIIYPEHPTLAEDYIQKVNATITPLGANDGSEWHQYCKETGWILNRDAVENIEEMKRRLIASHANK